MHPAFSVIVFTTATGAGYGMLVMLGLLAALYRLPADLAIALSATGTALVLITAGLLSSTAHLGRPERAWRAFSQWRSSWLSREGIASLVTFVPAVLLGLGWAIRGPADPLVIAAAVAAAACALATVVTTAMIYASLKPIPQWHSRYTVPGYLLYALMSGATLLDALLRILAAPADLIGVVAMVCTALGLIWKMATWRRNDGLTGGISANSATALRGGEIRSIEWPHTEENYVMKEMGYRIARKHAVKLRMVVQLFAFVIPFALLALALVSGPLIGALAAAVAFLAQAAGLLVERWLFFAEARHVVGLYYGR